MRDYDKAIEQYRRTLEVDPDFLIAHLQLGWAYERKGMFAEAIAEYRKAAELQNKSEAGERVGGVGGIEARIGRAYALSGNESEARKILGTLSKDGGVPPYNMALIHDGMGEKELAISYLEKVVEGGGQRFGLKTDPTWDDLRSDPKFQDLLARMESGQ
jgi:tetratricopeptide (TPR) repeat protein